MSTYVDRIYEQYAGTRPHCPAPAHADDLLRNRRPTFERRIAPLLPACKDAAILDLGCGYGEFLYFLQKRGYRESVGIDVNARQVETARDLGVRNVFYGGAAEFLQKAAGQFDCISALDVLEHVPKDGVLPLLDLIHGALRPGGRFLCQVPNQAAFYRPVFYMDFSHETPFTAPSLKQVLQLANFENVRVFPMGPVAHGLKSAIRRLVWKAITVGLRLTQTIEGGPPDPLDAIYTAAILAAGDKV